MVDTQRSKVHSKRHLYFVQGIATLAAHSASPRKPWSLLAVDCRQSTEAEQSLDVVFMLEVLLEGLVDVLERIIPMSYKG